MGEAVGQALPFAVGLALSPFPLVAMTLILGSGHGRAEAVVFALASVAGVAAVGAVVLVVAGDDAAEADGDPAVWVSVARLALGLLLLAYAAKGLVTRVRGGAGVDAGPPRWSRALEGLTPARAAGLGLLASALNPKNLALSVAAAAAIAQAGLGPGAAAASLAVVVAIGTLGVTVPLGLAAILGPRSDPVLAVVKGWVERHSPLIMALLALVLGALLIAEAAAGLSA